MPIRVTILWSQWSGYMDACARSLVEDFGCDVTIAVMPLSDEAPYSESKFFQFDSTVFKLDPETQHELREIESNPADITVVCGWHIEPYRKLARRLAGRSIRVLSMDNQWHGSLRQWAGVAVSPFYVRPLYERALVPGKRQYAFARKLGFRDDEILIGHLACDFDRFAASFHERQDRPLNKAFAFVGRLAPEKGLDVLLDAWKLFTGRRGLDWRLKIIGTGPLSPSSNGVPGVEQVGFVQPEDLPRLLLDATVFVLPSRWEPWALVLHEAAAAGMPIICTDVCGAADAFVEDWLNGAIVPAGDAEALAGKFEWISGLSEQELRAMGRRSYELASRRTPRTWAETVLKAAGNAVK
jgi:glycosyltransferase involved in cell wall biosynthesis